MSTTFNWDSSVKERMKDLLNSGELSDLILLVGPSRDVFKVHRNILALWSPVIADMIKHLGANEERIIFKDLSPHSMQLFLLFVYTGKFSGQEFGEVRDLFDTATALEFTGLVDKCSDVLKYLYKNDSVLQAFSKGITSGNETLIESSRKYICRNAKDVLEEKGFQDLPLRCIEEIVKQKDLNVDSEVDIFKAICRWGEAEAKRQKLDATDPSQIRALLDPLINFVRFPVMTREEFKDRVFPTGILGMKDLQILILQLLTPQQDQSEVQQRVNSTQQNGSNKAGDATATAAKTSDETKITPIPANNVDVDNVASTLEAAGITSASPATPASNDGNILGVSPAPMNFPTVQTLIPRSVFDQVMFGTSRPMPSYTPAPPQQQQYHQNQLHWPQSPTHIFPPLQYQYQHQQLKNGKYNGSNGGNAGQMSTSMPIPFQQQQNLQNHGACANGGGSDNYQRTLQNYQQYMSQNHNHQDSPRTKERKHLQIINPKTGNVVLGD